MLLRKEYFLPFVVANLMVFFAVSLHAQTPSWQWIQTGGGDGLPGGSSANPYPDKVIDAQTDALGNIYVGGISTYNPTFDTISFSPPNSNYGNNDFFLAKYTSCGDVDWCRVGGGASSDAVTSICMDKEGDIYCFLALNSSNSLSPTHVKTPQLDTTIIIPANVALAKFDKHGNLKRIKTFNTQMPPYDAFLKMRADGKLMTVCGNLNASGIDTAYGFSIAPNARNFLLFDTNFNCVGHALIDTLGTGGGIGLFSYSLDEVDNVYFTSINQTVTQLQILDKYFNSLSTNRAILIKADKNFHVTKNVVCNASATLYNNYSNGYVYFAGRSINNSAYDFDTTHTSLSYGLFNIYKMDTNYNLIYAKRPAQQTLSPVFTEYYAAASANRVYASYRNRGTVKWDSTTLVTPANTYDLGMVVFDAATGNVVNAELSGGTQTSTDIANVIRTDKQGNGYFIGTFGNTIGFGNDSMLANGTQASPDYFILKWGLSCTATIVCNSSITHTNTDSLYSFNANATGTGALSYQWSKNGVAFSTAATPTLVLTNVGTYSICVTVTDVNNCTSTDCDTVAITTFTCGTNISHTNTGSTYTFSSANNGTPPYTYAWLNNGSQFSSTANPTVQLSNGSNNICVSVTDANDCKATDCETIVVTGIEEDVTEEMALYPNPVNDKLFVGVSVVEGQSSEVILFDLSGRVVLKNTGQLNYGKNLLMVNTSDLADGVYELQLQTKNQKWRGRVVKTKQ